MTHAGGVQAHLPTLLGEVAGAPPYLAGLIEAKAAVEHGPAVGADGARVGQDFQALHAVLDAAQAGSALPDGATAHAALDDFVVRHRPPHR
ncbi:hypothetical protein [Streptomyces sp. NPDC090445]|uniref:hypothetical protein n=1 Tax=Streptomyces sp. NPDC090445 TaxID=3365963 RepID=UPI00382C8D72